MIKKYIKSGLLLAALFNVSATYSLDWYVGIAAGSASYDVPQDFRELDALTEEANSFPGIEASFDTDDSDTAIKVFGGFNVNPNFGVEVGYVDLGEMANEFSLESDGSDFPPGVASVVGSTSVYGFNGGVVGSLPFSDSVSLSGRAGAYFWFWEDEFVATDTTGLFFNDADSEEDEGADIYYGVALDISWFSLFY